MKRPLSIHGRLLVAALATTLVALVVTGWTLQRELAHVISQNLSAKIDTQVKMIERGIAPDGRLRPGRMIFFRDFDTTVDDWGWRVQTGRGRWQGGVPFGPAADWTSFLEERDGAVNARARAGDGTPMYVRVRRSATGTVEVAVPLERLDETLRPAMRKMLAALGLLAAVLVAATLMQLRFGLRPLRALRADLARVRNGDAQSITAAQPRELLPLAAEVNALVEQNAAGLAHARNHVANLAHGLKTPLATLALTLGRDGEAARARAQALVADLDRRIDHHLGRARAAAVGAGERARADAADVAAALLPAMRHLHAGRGVTIACALPSMPIGVDRQDLDEMLGNLLDNACRHARSAVRLTAASRDGLAHLAVEDDGPGIPEEALAAVTQAGVRLDESGRGYGFGLGIVRELSELYGGAVVLDRSPDLRGLRATLVLPLR